MKTYPTPWQRKVMWWALTALAISVIAFLSCVIVYYGTRGLGFLQPLLIPVAVAGILAYLLDPVVRWVCAFHISRTNAVLYVMALIVLPLVGIGFWVFPDIYRQSEELARQVPQWVGRGQIFATTTIAKYQARYGDNAVLQQASNWVQQQFPKLPSAIWRFLTGSMEGFLGIFGFLFGLVVVPVYLFFFLRDAATISERWSDYLPLRASAFKDEVVSCLTEINSYLIAFFRGQIIVTMIDGALIAIALLIMGLKAALVFGLMVAVLQLIPYLGIFLCWIPAVLTATLQWNDWQHPLAVTILFLVISQLDGFVIAPRIVGESVGLHPVTVIISVFAWGLLIGGLLGALLAVPLTATVKVLLKRYVWRRSPKSEHHTSSA